MKKSCFIIVLLLALATTAWAVPYPYGDYVLPEGSPEQVEKIVKDEHTVEVNFEGDSPYPWSPLSFAVLQSPKLTEAEVNKKADFEFWTQEEKAKELADRMRGHDTRLRISLALLADQDATSGYKYTNTTGTSYISRIILETSDGLRTEPSSILGGDSSLVAGHWMSVSLLAFFKEIDGVPIINEDTKWIRLWVIAGKNRIYFHFDFEH